MAVNVEQAICIPYRNRKKQLDFFIENSVPVICEHLPNTIFLIIEQSDTQPFNRGALLNVGFDMYRNNTHYFLTHDVDINPTNKCVEEFYTQDVDDEHVLGIYTSQCNTLGGIIKITNSTIHKINGFPNNMWGWGAEDKALQNRAEYYNITKITNLMNDRDHPEYLSRFANPEPRVCCDLGKKTKYHYDIFKNISKQDQLNYILSTGLNNLKYDIISTKNIADNVVKHIVVSLDHVC
jgi:hypothetical protein